MWLPRAAAQEIGALAVPAHSASATYDTCEEGEFLQRAAAEGSDDLLAAAGGLADSRRSAGFSDSRRRGLQVILFGEVRES